MKHPILSKNTPGGSEGFASMPFEEALSYPWQCDAYVVQYLGRERRNKESIHSENPLIFPVELYDFDTPGHADVIDHWDWANDALDALPPGFQGCLTAGGFRVWTLRAEEFVVHDGESWEAWRAYHAGRADALGAIIGATPDHATDDPGRLFRLPNVKRGDGKPCYPELVGSLGVATLAPLPTLPRKASAASEGSAASTLLGECFKALGWIRQSSEEKLTVRCPWAHEHTGDELAVVYAEGETGKFHCGHSHCQGRYTNEAIEAIKGMPAVEEVLKRWLYIQETMAEIKTEFVKRLTPTVLAPSGDKPPRFIDWGGINAPLGEVPWLVEALELCPGRPPMFISDSGVGKTWTLQSLALSIASGLPVFGRFPCRKGPVLHLSRDSGLRATKVRYQRLARGMGIDRADIMVFPHSLPLTDKMGTFQRKGFEEVAKEAERGGYALVILDSLAALCPGIDENSTEIGDPLRATVDDSCVWLWAHHTTKDGGGYRGSGAIKAAAGAIYMGTKAAPGAPVVWKPVKASEEHESGDLPTFQTEWQVDADGGSRIVAIDVPMPDRPEVVTPEQTTDRIRQDVLAKIRADGPASANLISESVRGKAIRVREVLKEMTHEGILTSDGRRYHLK